MGELLPGLALVDSALFRLRLGARAANVLARAGIGSWAALAGSTPAELFSLSGIGNEAVKEILRAALSEWAAAYLQAVQNGGEAASAQGTAPEQLQGLIGRAPDPIAERELLRRLLNPDDAGAQQLVKRLHEDEALRHLQLRQLLPGVGVAESPAFSIKLSVRAANCLGRADSDRLSALAGMTPADILELPEVGVKVAEGILAVALSEWAAAYLASVETSPPADRPANRAPPGCLDGEDGQASIMTTDLARAFSEVEKASGFDVFCRRWLDPDRPTQSEVAMELGVSGVRISQLERAVQKMLAKRLRDGDWPVSRAVSGLRSRLGSVALPSELSDALAALDPTGVILSDDFPHRRALMLQLADYRVSGEWVLGPDIEFLTNAVLGRLAESGPAALEEVSLQLARLGIRQALQLAWIVGQPGFRIVDGELVRSHDE